MKKVLYEELLPAEFVQRMQALRKSTQKSKTDRTKKTSIG